MNKLPNPKNIEEMDVVGDVFAMRFPRNSKLVELYIEDDGMYHFRAKFDRDYLGDLIDVCVDAQEHA